MAYSIKSQNFHEDRVPAEIAEEEIFSAFCSHFPTTFGAYTSKVHSDPNNHIERKQWDIKVTNPSGRVVTFEIKDDAKSLKTGNAFIETSSLLKPSGIVTTTADFWLQRVWVLGRQEIIMHKTSYLKEYLQRHDSCLVKLPDNYRDGYRTSAGGTLIPIIDFKVFGLRIGSQDKFRNYMERHS